jgi:V/A-type H+-transporting ATPase subunit I
VLDAGSWLAIVSYVLIGLGVFALLAFGGYGKKGAKRIFGGVGKLYGIVNFLSDILSYSRLFGLGLASAVVGMGMKQIALLIVDMLPAIGGVHIIGWIFAIPILLIGHTFNIGINTLGTYIHNSRLQYIEFFGKFYEGAGHQFLPLGINTKYTYIER